MRTKLFLILIVLLLSIGVAVLDYSHHAPLNNTDPNVEVLSKEVPNFSFTTIDTKETFHAHDFKGKTILINFWASWCAPCLYEFPMLVDLAIAHPDKFVLIMLSVDDSERQAYDFARGFCIRHNQMDFESRKLFPDHSNLFIAWDKEKEIAQDLFQTIRYPESIVVDQHLKMREKIVGVLTEENTATLLEIINE